MIIGIPKEIKDNEYRVAIVPAGVKELVAHKHQVLIEKQAGVGSGISDKEYIQAGASIIADKTALFAQSQLIVKVKEPLPEEYLLLQKGQILFTFLHLAPNPELTKALLKQEIIGIGYETIQKEDGSLPLLMPMSEVAGKLSVQVGAHYLQKDVGGRGILLGGVPGICKGEVTILGGGVAGINAAKIALGMGAKVKIIDINPARLNYLEDVLGREITTLISNQHNIKECALQSDLLVGAVLVPGKRAPQIISRDIVAKMRKGSVIVDIAIDQGGCVETSCPTTHSNPTYVIDGVIHYCVCNIPGIVSRSSTFALTNLSLPYILKIADQGIEGALANDNSLARGVNVYKNTITCQGVAEALNLPYKPLFSLINKT